MTPEQAEAADLAAARGYALTSMVREHDPATVDAYLDTIDPTIPREARHLIIALAAMVDPDAEDPLSWTAAFADAVPIYGRREFIDEHPYVAHRSLLEAVDKGTKAGRSAAELAVALGISQRHVVTLRREISEAA